MDRTSLDRVWKSFAAADHFLHHEFVHQLQKATVLKPEEWTPILDTWRVLNEERPFIPEHIYNKATSIITACLEIELNKLIGLLRELISARQKGCDDSEPLQRIRTQIRATWDAFATELTSLNKQIQNATQGESRDPAQAPINIGAISSIGGRPSGLDVADLAQHTDAFSRRYQAFVSSTYEDLKEERQYAMQALLETKCIPTGMELFPAANEEQWELIKRVIDDCDYYIVIVAGRYGSIGTGGKSYTEMEFDYASSNGKSILGFYHTAPLSLAGTKLEQTDSGRLHLTEFTKKVKCKMCKSWSTPDGLASAIKSAILNAIENDTKPGWVRAPHVLSRKGTRASNHREDSTPKNAPALGSSVTSSSVDPLHLGPEATTLLTEAAASLKGFMIVITTRTGIEISIGQKKMRIGDGPRNRALWQAALRQLLKSDLIFDPTGQGRLFKLTHEGYQVADTLKPEHVTSQQGVSSPTQPSSAPTTVHDPKTFSDLSGEAVKLLLEAFQDPTGMIHCIGQVISTNGKKVNDHNSPRSRALWESALGELVRAHLVEPASPQGTDFKITHGGYGAGQNLIESLVPDTAIAEAFSVIPWFSRDDLSKNAVEIRRRLLAWRIISLDDIFKMVTDTSITKIITDMYITELKRPAETPFDPHALATWGGMLYRLGKAPNIIEDFRNSLRKSAEWREKNPEI